MGDKQEKRRNKAAKLYRILGALQLILGIGLVICGGIGTIYMTNSETGAPYYLGGFLVGGLLTYCDFTAKADNIETCTFREEEAAEQKVKGTFMESRKEMLISVLFSTCIFFKTGEITDEDSARQVACGIIGQFMVCILTFTSCFVGLVVAGIGGCDKNNTCDPARDTMRYVIMAALVVAIGVCIFNMYITCKFGSYFGVVMKGGWRGPRMKMAIDTTEFKRDREDEIRGYH